MRILHVVPYYMPAIRYGGPVVSVHELCRALSARGHDVDVFTTDIDGPSRLDVTPGVRAQIDGVGITYFRSGAFRRVFWSMDLQKSLANDIKRFDLVHTHTTFLWPTTAAAAAARSASVPYILSPRGMLVKKLIRHKSRLAKECWIRAFERRNVEQAAAIHVTSDVEAAELMHFKWNLPRVELVINGVTPASSYQETEISADVREACAAGEAVLYFGRISWKKGLDACLSALRFAPAARLIIAGTDDEGFALELYRQALELNVADRVTIIPRTILAADKEFLFANAKLFLLMSLNENFGNTVLEAMLRGIPVLVGNNVGAAEVVSKSGGGEIIVAEAARIGAAMEQMLANHEWSRKTGAAGRAYVERYCSWDAVASQMEALYENLCNSPWASR